MKIVRVVLGLLGTVTYVMVAFYMLATGHMIILAILSTIWMTYSIFGAIKTKRYCAQRRAEGHYCHEAAEALMTAGYFGLSFFADIIDPVPRIP